MPVRLWTGWSNGHHANEQEETQMPHPVIHTEIRSENPDATREFFASLFGWKVASEGGFPGYTFIDTGTEDGPAVAISPRQGAEDEVLLFVAVENVAETLKRAEELGGTIVQPVQEVPGVSFGVFADALGHKVGVAAN
jgi:predicted enzyme related to lactoylglutathione lyase